MQVTAKSTDSPTDTDVAAEEPVDPGYVGKHRPSRMALMRQRVRVNQLATRNAAAD